MAYPSTTLYRNKLPTGTAGIGFYDSSYPDGDRPVDEYELDTGVKMLVTEGSANGSFMAIEIEDSVPWRFGNEPTRQVILGYGQGDLYSQFVDTSINNPVDPITGNQWLYKNPYTVKADGSWRYVRQLVGGYRSFDTNLNEENMWALYSGTVRAADGTGQMKTVRFRQGNLDDDGSHYGQVYTNYFDNLPTRSLIQFPANSAGDNAYSITNDNSSHPIFDEGWSLHEVTGFSGSDDQSDGLVFADKVLQAGPRNHGGFIYPSPVINTNTGAPILSSTYPRRWNWACWQAFCGDGDATFDGGDEFIQFGAVSRFRVTTTIDPDASVQTAYSLPITKIENSGKKAYSIFWGGMGAAINGKYIHYIDNEQTLDSDGVVATFPAPGV